MTAPPAISPARLLALAVALSMGAAISLGITRFAYGLLLPTMRADLCWSYTLAGAMNTANALGYLLGALVTPRLLKRHSAQAVMMWGAVLSSLFMAASGFFIDAVPLLIQRLLAGVSSAFVFIAGGLLAARLGAMQPARSGFLLGIYYGGTGVGITLSALLVPAVLEAAHSTPHSWTRAWWALAASCCIATALLAWPARAMGAAVPAPAAAQGDMRRFSWRQFGFALAGYGMFGMGYIGYMTFVIALLREQGAGPGSIKLFYALLGLAVIASSRIWAGLLDRYKGGQALAILNALVGTAAIVPALTSSFAAVLLSGIVFGGVFLSVVASTTALVRHNLPQAGWAAGISAFTIMFAAGQIVGPTIVGWIADGPGGLARGLVFSAIGLWTGAALASRQRPLAT
ncbi:MAG: YbfB/YjiJ family MFS transporter [Comamonadaceae bacterium]|nr:MAG: YbfB/YjiJ family MFS transporter [Comamonadaceae bacterium]